MAGKQNLNRFRPFAVLVLLVVAAGLLSYHMWPDETVKPTPKRDDALAARYAPAVAQGPGINPEPSHIYYRMAEDDTRILIAYHITWPYEKDERSKGMEAAWNKMFYTGGLKLQQIIFGPEDNEVVEIAVSKQTGKILRIRYESAGHQGEERSGVEVEKIDRPCLEVTTWNHMFELTSYAAAQGKQVYYLQPEFFTDQLWDYYKMTKKRQSLLSQDRAHLSWERAQ